MRDGKAQTLLPAFLCAAALLTFGCDRAEDHDGEAAAGREPVQTAEAPAPQPNELRPAPRSVDVREESADVAARERELAARETELDARESRLRESQAPRPAPPDRRAEVTPRPRPAPAPEAPRAEEPQPTEPDEPAEVAEQPAEEPENQPEDEPAVMTTVTVPAGTQLDVEFTRSVASNTAAPGDTFRVRVAHDVMEDGEVAIPAGSEILGEVTEAVPLRKVGGQARLALRFTDLVLPSGATVPIDASFVQQGRSETGKDAATIGGVAAGGAVLGRILSKGNRSKGAVIGAIIGAAAGTAIASKTAGEEVVIPEGSVVGLKLDGSLEVRVARDGR